MNKKHMELAILANGCFWCTEAVFQKLAGVEKIVPVYTGGQNAYPTYEQVSSGTSGHAEAIKIWFDPKIVSFEELLYVFFETHDPTTLNRQGHDVGTQYRSAIFTLTTSQQNTAHRVIKKLDNSKKYKSQIVTSVNPTVIEEVYEAEDYHHNYYNQHKKQPYCQIVIDPKLKKIQQLPVKLKD